ncbi:MAG: hypothetical protein ABI056_03085 [Caulobacteraceae bacterium]
MVRMSPSRLSALRLPLALTLGVALAAGSAMARPKPPPPPPEYVPPPPPPPAGPVGLPDRILADAAAYSAYLGRASATSPGFADAAAVAHALRDGAAYEPKALVRGAIAYAAIAALEDADFISEIRAAGTTPDYRHAMAGYILSNPAYVFLFKHSDGAAGLAREALGGAGLKLYLAGKSVKIASFTIQHQGWSKQDVADRPGRLAAMESFADSPMPSADEEVGPLQRAATGAAPLSITAPPAEPPYTPLVARALQLAAIAAIGEAGNEAYDALTALTEEDDTAACLHMAKLNFHQCLAVAKPNYEDVFCLGQHAMADTGSCLVKNAGMTLPADDPPPPPTAPAPTPTPKKRVHHVRG